MASPPVLDIARLLAPISDDAPTGVDLREADDGAEYYRLRDIRAEAREQQKLAETGEGAEQGSAAARAVMAWQELGEECQKLLTSTTKDLELASWLIESLLRSGGFAGMRDGFKVAVGLVTQFWDGLHSIKDEDDPTSKGQPVASLNGVGSDGALLAPMRSVPITPNTYPGPFAFWQADAALKKNDLTEIEANAREADRRFYPVLLSDIAEAKAAVSELTEALRERMGSANMPPTSQLRDTLDAIAEMVRRIAGPLAEEPVDAPGEAEGEGAEAEAGGGGPGGGRAGTARPGTFETREQAFAMLLAVAKFFRDREPHSPLSYTLEEAVRRGRLPLPELLSELLGDDETRNRLLTAAGIKPPPPPASE
jgi:type VI secretion system protein ImpA